MENEKENENWLLVGKRYKLVFYLFGDTFTFTADVISIKDGFISMIDKYGKKYNYNLNCLVSYEEVMK